MEGSFFGNRNEKQRKATNHKAGFGRIAIYYKILQQKAKYPKESQRIANLI
jgi:hypothetical protein